MNKAERIDTFKSMMKFLDNKDTLVALLDSKGFFTAPASTKYHGAYEGGLFDHSLATTEALLELTENNNLTWELARSPFIVGMFHDICKADAYLLTDEGKYTYNNETLLKGHGEKSVMVLSSMMLLTEEEIACIRYHMGAFTDKEEWNFYTRAVRTYPNVLWTHTADMIAAHLQGI